MLVFNQTRLFAILATACCLASAASKTQYEQEAIKATNTLQKIFYNETSGLWIGYHPADNTTAQFWWNSANCITTLADLTKVDESTSRITYPVFSNTFEQAQKFNLKQLKMNTDGTSDKSTCIASWMWTCPDGMNEDDIPDDLQDGGFDNSFFDDRAWWALGWLNVWDLTNDDIYLEAAVDLFNGMLSEGYNATCGAMWWNTQHQQQNAITNGLFLQLAANIASRVDNSDYYLGWAKKQWAWFENSGLLQPSGLIVDGLNNETCEANTGDPTFTYNQGVIIGSLVELYKLDPNETYIDIANKIAKASIQALSNDNGILTEYGSNGSPDLGNDGPTFKGVYARNLQVLAEETNDQQYIDYIQTNADSIWTSDRSPQNGTLGNVWDKYYGQLLGQGHCAALDMLVAAAAVS